MRWATPRASDWTRTSLLQKTNDPTKEPSLHQWKKAAAQRSDQNVARSAPAEPLCPPQNLHWSDGTWLQSATIATVKHYWSSEVDHFLTGETWPVHLQPKSCHDLSPASHLRKTPPRRVARFPLFGENEPRAVAALIGWASFARGNTTARVKSPEWKLQDLKRETATMTTTLNSLHCHIISRCSASNSGPPPPPFALWLGSSGDVENIHGVVQSGCSAAGSPSDTLLPASAALTSASTVTRLITR